MSSLINTQIETSKNLKRELFATLKLLTEGKVNLSYVEGVCSISEQIISTSRLDFEVAKKTYEIEMNNRTLKELK